MSIQFSLGLIALVFTIVHAVSNGRFPLWPAVLVLSLMPVVMGVR